MTKITKKFLSSYPVVSGFRCDAFKMSSLCTFAFNDRIAAGADFDDDAEFWRTNRGGTFLHCV